jgi:uncharacterized protein (DUF1697 family)
MKKRYVALLRAITNVSMKSFRERMEELGFTDVESYGSSGNLMFNAQGKDTMSLARRITSQFGTPAIVLTNAQLARVIGQDPYGSTILFLVRSPTAAKRKKFLELDFGSPQPVLHGKTIYFVHPARLRRKRATFDFERALDILGTARTGRVVRQILAHMRD